MRLNSSKFNKIFYLFVFLILILGVYLRIYNYSIFKIFVPLIIGGLGFYFHSKNDIISYLKIGVMVLFLGHNANQYFYILFTILIFNKSLLPSFKGLVRYIYILFGIGFLSFLINQVIEINIFSFPFFVASFFFPIAFFLLAFQRLGDYGKNEIVEFYLKLVAILSITALIQFITTGVIADGLTGGTTNAHTLGFHLSASFIFVLSKFIINRGIEGFKLHELTLLFLTMPIMFLADAKYLMGNMVVAIFITYILFHTKKYFKPFVITITALLLIFSMDLLKNANIPISAKASVDASFIIDRFQETAKYGIYEKSFLLASNEPLVFFIGSGPGTFLSRAANSRAYDTMEKKASTGGGTSVEVESKLPSFIPPHTSWITHKYAVEYFGKDWMGTLFDYRSSLVSLYWEFGVVGFLFFLAFFRKIITNLNNLKNQIKYYQTDALFLSSFIIYYLLNASIAYYFEYPETQILFWMFIGLFYNRNLDKAVRK